MEDKNGKKKIKKIRKKKLKQRQEHKNTMKEKI